MKAPDPACIRCAAQIPKFRQRLFSVWYRHLRVYIRYLISNGLPPFLEPLFFLAGIGLGLGSKLAPVDSVPYLIFLASGMPAPPAMFTAAFECTYGTFIRMNIDRVYDGMLGAAISERDLIIGEIIFAGSKGLFFSASVMLVLTPFGLLSYPVVLLAPFVGFITGIMFGALGMVITSFVKTINHFNIFITGFLTPMFFFSGLVFPLKNLPLELHWIAELLPLTHSVRIIRSCALSAAQKGALFSILYMLLFSLVFSMLAVKLLRKRLID